MTQTSAVEQYFELRKQLMAINERIEALKPAVAGELRRTNGFASLDGYDLLLRTYKSWDYSEVVDEMQQRLNEVKQQERQTGAAKIREQRDMLILKAHRDVPGVPEVMEEPAPYGEWEPDDSSLS